MSPHALAGQPAPRASLVNVPRLISAYYTHQPDPAERLDAPATPEQKAALNNLSPDLVEAAELAGEKIVVKLTRAPSNLAPIGGLKVVTANGWFAARPSGTENIYKIYAESFKGAAHLKSILAEAQAIVSAALQKAGVA